MLAVVVLAAVLLAVGCDSKSRGEAQTAASEDADHVTSASQKQGSPKSSDEASDSETPAATEAPRAGDLAAYTADIDGSGPLHALIETSMGTIDCRLYTDEAPLTVANFVGLATGKKEWVDPQSGELRKGEPFYDGVVFHRVIPNFLIQAGDRTGTGAAGPGYTIPDEFAPSLRHDKPGTLSMANKGKPDSAGSQWFITEAPIPHLDHRNAVFGRCEDLDVVKSIARVPTGPDNRPKEPPTIETIRFVRRSAAAQAD